MASISGLNSGQASRIGSTTKLLPLGQQTSPSRIHNVPCSYHHHLVMHLARKFKVIFFQIPEDNGQAKSSRITGCALKEMRETRPFLLDGQEEEQL